MASDGGGHRWFAAFYERWLGRSRAIDDRRQWTAAGARGRVLEVGIGTGLSIRYYHGIEALVALEPDAAMRRYLRPRAAAAPFPVQVLPTSAEKLPFADGSFDTAVANLVFCTAGDPARSLAELRRVLKPGGELRFYEHVRDSGIIGALQDAITPLWRWLGAGCHPNRRTEESIRAAGLEIVHIERFRVGGLPHILGVARVPPA